MIFLTGWLKGITSHLKSIVELMPSRKGWIFMGILRTLGKVDSEIMGHMERYVGAQPSGNLRNTRTLS